MIKFDLEIIEIDKILVIMDHQITALPKSVCMELQIPTISKLESIKSREIWIRGIPWIVKISKDKQSLAANLYCAKTGNSPNGSLSAMASFKLLSLNGDANTISQHIGPCVFNTSGIGYGTSSLIKWHDLLDPNKKYVENDTINLEVKVTPDNPNATNRCGLDFKCVHKCSDSNYAMFRLTLSNIHNLMATLSPEFNLLGKVWDFQISKTRAPHLDIMLRLKEHFGNVECKMAIKVVSSKKDVRSFEKSVIRQYDSTKRLVSTSLLSWDVLINAENGYVNDNSVTLEIEVQSDEPNAKRIKINQTPEMECPICFKCIANQNLSSTPCGHVFCSTCIDKSIRSRAVCPSCDKPVRLSTLRRLYLPM